MSPELPIGVLEHQKKEEALVHYSEYTTPQAIKRSKDPKDVTCLSCRFVLVRENLLKENT